MTLTIDLNAFPKTPADTPAGSDLLRRVDRRVASYYLAVPLADLREAWTAPIPSAMQAAGH